MASKVFGDEEPKDLGKKDSDERPTPVFPDMSPDTRSDEKTEVDRGQTSVKHPPPPPVVNTVDGLEDVTQTIFRSFMVLYQTGLEEQQVHT